MLPQYKAVYRRVEQKVFMIFKLIYLSDTNLKKKKISTRYPVHCLDI